MSTTRINPEDLNPQRNTTRAKGKGGINPLVVGGVAVGGAAAAAGVTAFALSPDDEPINEEEILEGTNVFEETAEKVNREVDRRAEEKAAEEEPKVEEEEPEEKPEEKPDEKPATKEEQPANEEKTEDEVIADIDPEAAAKEITGEHEEIDANDIEGGAAVQFGAPELVYTEDGEQIVATMTDGDSVYAIIDVDADGQFDVIYDPVEGAGGELPIAINVADIEMQESNHDEYIARIEGIEVDPVDDSTIDTDMNFG